MASILIAMAFTLLAMASNLIGMASNLLGILQPNSEGDTISKRLLGR